MKKLLAVLAVLALAMPVIAMAEGNAPKEFVVYSDKNSKDNHYIPSGWMGDTGDIKMNDQSADNPYSGTTAIQFARIDAVSSGPFQTIPASSEYIGSTEPDSPVPFSISVLTKASATPGNYTLQLKISYFNHSNFQVSKIINVPVLVTTASTSRIPATTQDTGIIGWIRVLLGIR